METIYSLLDLLPFEWLEFNFMKNAFLAVLLVTPLFGLLSTMVVSSRMAFFSDSLGHGAFTGIAIGSLVGLFSPRVSLIIFSVLFAFFITYVKSKSSSSTDTVIGVFSSIAIALGLTIMSLGGSFNKFSSFLIGDLLSITPEDLLALLVALIAVFVFWGVIFNRLLLLSINPSFAKSRGINVLCTEVIFAALIAVVVSISIEWVGILLINSLLVLPAAAARNVTGSVKAYHLVSVAIAFVSGVVGLIFAYYAGVAAGSAIVLAAAVLFFLTLSLKPFFIR